MKTRSIVKLLIVAAAVTVSSGASAALVRLTGTLSGLAENPPNASPGAGVVFVELNTSAHTLQVQSTFSGLLPTTAAGAPNGTTAAHIHCCTTPPGNVGVATATPSFPGFPLGVTAGSFDQTYNTLLASTWNPAFITANGGSPLAAETVFLAGLIAGQTYFNIHTTAFTGGEIRSFLTVTQLIPEPGTLALFGLGLLAAALPARRRSR